MCAKLAPIRPEGLANYGLYGCFKENGAGDEIRTHDPNLGKILSQGFSVFRKVF